MTYAYIKKHIEDLCASSQDQSYINQLKDEVGRVKTHYHVTRKKPLTQQIEELMQSIQPQMLNRPWTMAELVLRLSGKYRDRPHAQNVGDALRRTGWKSIRQWGKGYNGVRLWIPPCDKNS